jgi:hypothetical protein
MNEEEKQFIAHLKRADKIVSKWPKWEQNIFGKVVNVNSRTRKSHRSKN